MRKWLSIISLFILLLGMFISMGVWQFNRVLSDLNVERFSYRLTSLSFTEINFSQLSFFYNGDNKQEIVTLQNVRIDWQWPSWFSPVLNSIVIERAQLSERSKENAASANEISNPALILPQTWNIPESFPNLITIQNFLVELSCPAGICFFAGNAKVQKNSAIDTATSLQVKLHLTPEKNLHSHHQLKVDVLYSVNQNLPKIEATVTADQVVDVQFATHLEHTNEFQWVGNLVGTAFYPDAWWLDYLSQWGVKFDKTPGATTTITADSGQINTPVVGFNSTWQLALTPLLAVSSDATSAEWKRALTGNLFVDTKITTPITILNVGDLSGQAKITLAVAAGQLSHYELAAEVDAKQLVIPEKWRVLGLQTDSIHLSVNSKTTEEVKLDALPITFSGRSQGSVRATLAGDLSVDTFSKKIIFKHLDITATTKKLKPLDGLQLDNASINLQATGEWQAGDNTLSPQLLFDGKVSLKVDKLTHALVTPKPWQWQGAAHGSLENFEVSGALGVGSSLIINHKIKRKKSVLQLDWQVPNIFLLAANPIADTLKAWPPLLTLARGKINASGNVIFNIEKNRLTKNNATLQLFDVAGIYDTTAFEGLNCTIKSSAAKQALEVTADSLSIEKIDKGIVVGPLSAAGTYRANWGGLAQGKLALKYFNGALMGGTFKLGDKVNVGSAASAGHRVIQEFDFSRETQNLSMELNNIDLKTLLLNYPSSELSGSGQLSGTVPIEINGKGIRIFEGVISAKSPGGQLKYQSPRAAAIAKTQPSMKLITEALDDFHYTVLASQVNYDENGKLLLSVRLEGKNPALENGRPINLNVNLEEDVPAMLASIQLSSKITDVVKKRLQEHMQKKQNTTVTQ